VNWTDLNGFRINVRDDSYFNARASRITFVGGKNYTWWKPYDELPDERFGY